MSEVSLYHGDCLEVMKLIPDASVDMVLADLPYGTTQCAWDVVIPFEPLWEQYLRIAKPEAAIVLCAAQPFSSLVVASNPETIATSGSGRKAMQPAFSTPRSSRYGRMKASRSSIGASPCTTRR